MLALKERPVLGACNYCAGPITSGIAVENGYCCGTHHALDGFERELRGEFPRGDFGGEDSGQVSTRQISARIAKEIVCRDCRKTFPKPVQRGRPPVKCPECRENVSKPQNAKEVPKMSRQVSISIMGPNLPSGSMIQVHKQGCSDLAKPIYRGHKPWDIEVENLADVVEAVYPADNFDYDPSDPSEVEMYASDIKIFPCVSFPTTKPERPKGKGNACRQCGKVIPPTGRRGRPAVRCNACKEKGINV